MRIEVRSRTGNAVLGVLGGLYLISAVALLVYDLMQAWDAASMIDRAMQGALIISALVSLFFIFTALQNLGLRRASGHASPLHREDAVIAP